MKILFVLDDNKTAVSAQKVRAERVSGKTVMFTPCNGHIGAFPLISFEQIS